MSSFDKKSRYAKLEPYTVLDSRGRTVSVIPTPGPMPERALLGYHIRIQGERIDHLAARYLGDNAGFWRLCLFNDVVYPEVLTEAERIAIPGGK